MQWEFLGVQDLPEMQTRGKGHTYKVSMWRSPVPGGWMIMSMNNRSSDPQPLMTFYPDADHVWVGNAPPEANYLLRPAAGAIASSPDQLLRAYEEDDTEPKTLGKLSHYPIHSGFKVMQEGRFRPPFHFDATFLPRQHEGSFVDHSLMVR